MNSRNGYAATATRSRGFVGNATEGLELAARPKLVNKPTPAAADALCTTNSLRVVALMRESLPKIRAQVFIEIQELKRFSAQPCLNQRTLIR
jgi:hypothetical protein